MVLSAVLVPVEAMVCGSVASKCRVAVGGWSRHNQVLRVGRSDVTLRRALTSWVWRAVRCLNYGVGSSGPRQLMV